LIDTEAVNIAAWFAFAASISY